MTKDILAIDAKLSHEEVDDLHNKVVAESADLGLPLPRLQLTWAVTGVPGQRICFYDLLMPVARLDIRNLGIELPREESANDNEEPEIRLTNMCAARFGHTTVTNGGGILPKPDKELETPFRDGAHVQWDIPRMKMRAFVVCGKRFKELEEKGSDQ